MDIDTKAMEMYLISPRIDDPADLYMLFITRGVFFKLKMSLLQDLNREILFFLFSYSCLHGHHFFEFSWHSVRVALLPG